MKRIVAVDIAKAICIILVVIGHYTPDNSPGWYAVLNKIIYSFHMPLFMFASGYIYMETKKEESYGSSTLKKIKRLMVPYFSVSVVIVTIKLLSMNFAYVEDPVSWHAYPEILYRPSAAAFFWFIWALFIIFLIVPLFKSRKARLLLFFGCMLLDFLPLSLPSVFSLPQVKDMFVYFMLGVVFVDFKAIQQAALKIPTVLVYLIFTGLFSLWFIFRDSATLNPNNGLIPVVINRLITYAGIFAICKLSISISHIKIQPNHWLLIVADNTYIIYLFHTTFMGFAKALLHKIPVLLVSQNQLIFTAVAIVIIATGLVCPIVLNNWFLKRNKTFSYLFGLKYYPNTQGLKQKNLPIPLPAGRQVLGNETLS